MAENQVLEHLKDVGFGIFTQIDVTETFKKMTGLNFVPYKIPGACNP